MALKAKIPCLCTTEHWLKIHPELIDKPDKCLFCHGNKVVHRIVRFDYIDGKFINLNNNDVRISDIGELLCQCGDVIYWDACSMDACSCGRIYKKWGNKKPYHLLVNNKYIDKTDCLIRQYLNIQKKIGNIQHDPRFKNFKIPLVKAQ